MLEIMNMALDLIEAQEDFIIAHIISQSGSTPRGIDAKMLIRENGDFIGTVGGGLVEADVQSVAKNVLKNKKAIIKEYKLNHEDAAQMGMICGGGLTIFIQYIPVQNGHCIDVFHAAANAIAEQKTGYFITLIDTEKGGNCCNQWFVNQNGILIGEDIKEELIKQIHEIYAHSTENQILIKYEGQIYFVEALTPKVKVYIFGAGHVGQKLAPLLNYVNFYTIVLDDRKEFANKDRFPSADQIVVLDSFDNIFKGIEIDSNSYVVIVTRGHKYDKEVLAQALFTKAGYIGMIGSLKKRNEIYELLKQEGHSLEALKKVYSPIGLSIQAQTPEEIGISIVAELIQARAEQQGKKNE